MPLQQLHIQQLGLFEDAQFSLPEAGYHVLLGETGAGKSLVIHALQWLLGETVSPKEALREGQVQGKVEACFQAKGSYWQQIQALCQQHGVEALEALPLSETPPLGELWLSREFSPLASRFRCNGTLVNRSFVDQLSPLLLQVQGQHTHVQLLKPSQQRQALDALGGQEQQVLLAAVHRLHLQWSESKASLLAWQQQRQQLEQRLHLLTMQAEELAELAIASPTEDADLKQELKRLQSVESLQQGYGESLALLSEGQESGEAFLPSVKEQVHQALRVLTPLQSSEPQLAPVLEALEGVAAQVQDAAHQLHLLQETLEASPQRVQEIVARLDALNRYKRLYGPSLEAVLQHQQQVEAELQQWQQASESPQALAEQVARLEGQLQQQLDALTVARQVLATQLTDALQALLQQLMLPHARFEVRLLPKEAEEHRHPLGQEEVCFFFSANPGERLKPLAKAASGGELARLMLALVVATESTLHAEGGKSFVFDELDTGTSGEAAKAIARLYQQLGQQHQVLAITHQALVAASSDAALFVEKQVYACLERGENRTRSVVRLLSDADERMAAIATLAFGDSHNPADETAQRAAFASLLQGSV